MDGYRPGAVGRRNARRLPAGRPTEQETGAADVSATRCLYLAFLPTHRVEPAAARLTHDSERRPCPAYSTARGLPAPPLKIYRETSD